VLIIVILKLFLIFYYSLVLYKLLGVFLGAVLLLCRGGVGAVLAILKRKSK
tara:strand:- start:3631 stop:3783 length:153 start_codon:yes stop_codon:yes gene_type:complete